MKHSRRVYSSKLNKYTISFKSIFYIIVHSWHASFRSVTIRRSVNNNKSVRVVVGFCFKFPPAKHNIVVLHVLSVWIIRSLTVRQVCKFPLYIRVYEYRINYHGKYRWANLISMLTQYSVDASLNTFFRKNAHSRI